MSLLPQNKVVVPVDFSDNSQKAIQDALEMVDDPADVHVVHVLLPLDNVSPGVVWGGVDDKKREKSTREYFEKYLQERDISGVTVEVLFGDPGLEIADYADGVNADLIIIPSHGYHGVKRLFLGSVAERVIRHARCSVLVLRRSDAD